MARRHASAQLEIEHPAITALEAPAATPGLDPPALDPHDYTPMLRALVDGIDQILPVVEAEQEYAIASGLSAVPHAIARSILTNARQGLGELLRRLPDFSDVSANADTSRHNS